MDEKELGGAVQSARQQAGLTQQQLCLNTGLSFSTLAKIERGAIKAPSIFTLIKIAQALNITVEELMGVSIKQPSLVKKTSKTGIKFVYFDINGVMVRFFQRAFSRLAEDAKVSPDSVESVFWHYNDAVCRGDMSAKEFNAVLETRLGLPGVDWMDYYLEAVDPVVESRECFDWVSQHFHVGLMSNIFPGYIKIMQERKIIPSGPNITIIDSSEVGSIKPEQAIYDIAQKRSGHDPSQILLIDDSRPNLMAAEKKGWHVLWFEYYSPAESIVRVKSALE
jgi:FMN phosphatase YigB (HAD superfamily)/DNA-binding XRE family transcriptional regulator